MFDLGTLTGFGVGVHNATRTSRNKISCYGIHGNWSAVALDTMLQLEKNWVNIIEIKYVEFLFKTSNIHLLGEKCTLSTENIMS